MASLSILAGRRFNPIPRSCILALKSLRLSKKNLIRKQYFQAPSLTMSEILFGWNILQILREKRNFICFFPSLNDSIRVDRAQANWTTSTKMKCVPNESALLLPVQSLFNACTHERVSSWKTCQLIFLEGLYMWENRVIYIVMECT